MNQQAIRSFVHCEDAVVKLTKRLKQQQDVKASALQSGNSRWLNESENAIADVVRSLSIAKTELLRTEDQCRGIAGFQRSIHLDDLTREVIRAQIGSQRAPMQATPRPASKPRPSTSKARIQQAPRSQTRPQQTKPAFTNPRYTSSGGKVLKIGRNLG